MANPVSESQSFKNFTATTTITVSETQPNVRLLGIFVASATAGTLKVQSGSATVVNTFSVEPAVFYPIPAECNGTVTITVGGTLDATVFYTT